MEKLAFLTHFFLSRFREKIFWPEVAKEQILSYKRFKASGKIRRAL
jgi:hypothetical protein